MPAPLMDFSSPDKVKAYLEGTFSRMAHDVGSNVVPYSVNVQPHTVFDGKTATTKEVPGEYVVRVTDRSGTVNDAWSGVVGAGPNQTLRVRTGEGSNIFIGDLATIGENSPQGFFFGTPAGLNKYAVSPFYTGAESWARRVMAGFGMVSERKAVSPHDNLTVNQAVYQVNTTQEVGLEYKTATGINLGVIPASNIYLGPNESPEQVRRFSESFNIPITGDPNVAVSNLNTFLKDLNLRNLRGIAETHPEIAANVAKWESLIGAGVFEPNQTSGGLLLTGRVGGTAVTSPEGLTQWDMLVKNPLKSRYAGISAREVADLTVTSAPWEKGGRMQPLPQQFQAETSTVFRPGDLPFSGLRVQAIAPEHTVPWQSGQGQFRLPEEVRSYLEENNQYLGAGRRAHEPLELGGIENMGQLVDRLGSLKLNTSIIGRPLPYASRISIGSIGPEDAQKSLNISTKQQTTSVRGYNLVLPSSWIENQEDLQSYMPALKALTKTGIGSVEFTGAGTSPILDVQTQVVTMGAFKFGGGKAQQNLPLLGNVPYEMSLSSGGTMAYNLLQPSKSVGSNILSSLQAVPTTRAAATRAGFGGSVYDLLREVFTGDEGLRGRVTAFERQSGARTLDVSALSQSMGARSPEQFMDTLASRVQNLSPEVNARTLSAFGLGTVEGEFPVEQFTSQTRRTWKRQTLQALMSDEYDKETGQLVRAGLSRSEATRTYRRDIAPNIRETFRDEKNNFSLYTLFRKDRALAYPAIAPLVQEPVGIASTQGEVSAALEGHYLVGPSNWLQQNYRKMFPITPARAAMQNMVDAMQASKLGEPTDWGATFRMSPEIAREIQGRMGGIQGIGTKIEQAEGLRDIIRDLTGWEKGQPDKRLFFPTSRLEHPGMQSFLDVNTTGYNVGEEGRTELESVSFAAERGYSLMNELIEQEATGTPNAGLSQRLIGEYEKYAGSDTLRKDTGGMYEKIVGSSLLRAGETMMTSWGTARWAANQGMISPGGLSRASAALNMAFGVYSRPPYVTTGARGAPGSTVPNVFRTALEESRQSNPLFRMIEAGFQTARMVPPGAIVSSFLQSNQGDLDVDPGSFFPFVYRNQRGQYIRYNPQLQPGMNRKQWFEQIRNEVSPEAQEESFRRLFGSMGSSMNPFHQAIREAFRGGDQGLFAKTSALGTPGMGPLTEAWNTIKQRLMGSTYRTYKTRFQAASAFLGAPEQFTTEAGDTTASYYQYAVDFQKIETSFQKMIQSGGMYAANNNRNLVFSAITDPNAKGWENAPVLMDMTSGDTNTMMANLALTLGNEPRVTPESLAALTYNMPVRGDMGKKEYSDLVMGQYRDLTKRYAGAMEGTEEGSLARNRSLAGVVKSAIGEGLVGIRSTAFTMLMGRNVEYGTANQERSSNLQELSVNQRGEGLINIGGERMDWNTLVNRYKPLQWMTQFLYGRPGVTEYREPGNLVKLASSALLGGFADQPLLKRIFGTYGAGISRGASTRDEDLRKGPISYIIPGREGVRGEIRTPEDLERYRQEEWQNQQALNEQRYPTTVTTSSGIRVNVPTEEEAINNQLASAESRRRASTPTNITPEQREAAATRLKADILDRTGSEEFADNLPYSQRGLGGPARSRSSGVPPGSQPPGRQPPTGGGEEVPQEEGPLNIPIRNRNQRIIGSIGGPELQEVISNALGGARTQAAPAPGTLQPVSGEEYQNRIDVSRTMAKEIADVLRSGRRGGGRKTVSGAVAHELYSGIAPYVREQIGRLTPQGDQVQFEAGAFTQAWQALPEQLAGLVSGETNQQAIRAAGQESVSAAFGVFSNIAQEQGLNIRQLTSRIPGFQTLLSTGKRLLRHTRLMENVGAEQSLPTASPYWNSPEAMTIAAAGGNASEVLRLNAASVGGAAGSNIESMMAGFEVMSQAVSGTPAGAKGKQPIVAGERAMLGESIQAYGDLTKKMEDHIRTVAKYKGSMTDLDDHLGKMASGNAKRTEQLAETMKSIQDKEVTLRRTGFAISKELNIPTEKGFLTPEQIQLAKGAAVTEDQLGLIEKYSKTEAEVAAGRAGAADTARGRSPLDQAGRASRMMLGGFGLMYLRSIWDIMTGPGTAGYAESMAFQGGFEQGYGAPTGGMIPTMTPQMRIQRAAMMQGGPTAMALQNAQANIMERYPAAWNAFGLGQAAVGGAGVAAWVTQGMLSMPFAAAAPIIGGVAALAGIGAAGLQLYGATQDYMGTAAGLANSAQKNVGKNPIEQFLGTNIFQSGAWTYEEIARIRGSKGEPKVQEATEILTKVNLAAKLGIAPNMPQAITQIFQQVMGRAPTRAESDQYMSAFIKQQAAELSIEPQALGAAQGLGQVTGMNLGAGTGSQFEMLGTMIQQGVPIQQIGLAVSNVQGMTRAQQYQEAGRNISSYIQQTRAGQGLDLLRQENILRGSQLYENLGGVAEKAPLSTRPAYLEQLGNLLPTAASQQSFLKQAQIQQMRQSMGLPYMTMGQGVAGYYGEMTAEETAAADYRAQAQAQIEQSRMQIGVNQMTLGGTGNMAWANGYTQLQLNQVGTQQSFGMAFGQQLIGGGMGGARANGIAQAFTQMGGPMFNMYQGMANMNPLQWSAYALQNPGLAAQLPQTMMGTGGTSISNRFMFAADIGAGGLTGMPWGTSSLAFPDQVGKFQMTGMPMAQAVQMSSIQTAGQIWGGQSYGAAGQGLINALIKGGTMGGQAYQLQQQAAQQAAQSGIQLQQLEVQARYQPQFWDIQDRMRNLGYAQTEWSFGQQEQQLAMNNRNFNANMGIQAQQMQQQRQWTREDWQYQGQVRGLQWGWKQEDFGEEVRFMTGRSRRLAERQMGREITLHDMEDEQIQKQKQRQQETWSLEDKRFELQKRQHTEENKFQEEAIKKQREFFDQRKQLEQEQVKLERAYWQENYDLSVKAAKASAAYAAVQAEQAKIMQELSNYSQKMVGEGNLFNPQTMKDLWTVLTDIDPIFASYIEKLKEEAKIKGDMGGGESGTGTSGGSTSGGVTSSGDTTPTPDHYEGEPASGGRVYHWDGHQWRRIKESASGNYVEAGEMSYVNERGPELFKAAVSGEIIPLYDQNAWQSTAITPGANRGGGKTVVNINIGGQHLTRFILDALRKEINV